MKPCQYCGCLTFQQFPDYFKCAHCGSTKSLLAPIQSEQSFTVTFSFIDSIKGGDVTYTGVTQFDLPSHDYPVCFRLTLENGRMTGINAQYVLAYTVERE